MFSHCYQIGESIEIYNSQDKKLLSKWGFIGKHSKVYDPHLHNYEMVLSTGNLSKMEIPKSSSNNKNKSLSLFQGFIVFQLYLFTSKQLTIEVAISDTTNAKRRLIFSTNNIDLVINQLHCRIPIFKFPIGRWVNLSIDVLSFVSKCYKNLTFRSVDYISLSMSGKVRYIFTMRTPLIEVNNNFELDEEGNIINFNDNNNNNNIDIDLDFDDDSNCKMKDNLENVSFSPGAKDVPDKFKFPPREVVINMNIDCNKVFSEIYLENENKQILLSQKELYRSNPIMIQDTADANNMDKSLKYRHQAFMNQKKINKTRYDYIDDEQIQNYKFQRNHNIINDKINYRNNITHKTNFLKNSSLNGMYGIYNNNKQGNHFNNVGNLIISHNNNNNNSNKIKLNKKSTYDFKRNNIDFNMNKNNIGYNDFNDDLNKKELNNEKEFISISKEDNNNERYDNYFNKEEYNKLYQKGQGIASQVKKNLHINCNNDSSIKEFDKKMKYQISTIKNDKYDKNNDFDFNNDFDIEKEILENNKDIDFNSENNNRPFSPPITKIEDENKDFLD